MQYEYNPHTFLYEIYKITLLSITRNLHENVYLRSLTCEAKAFIIESQNLILYKDFT